MPFPSNILDVFRGSSSAQPGKPTQPAQPGTGDQPAQPNLASGDRSNSLEAAGTPGAGQPAKPANAQENPLDNFSKLWDDEVGADGKPVQGKSQQTGLTVDPAKIREHASKLNFSRNIDPQLVTKALGGDAESFLKILDSVGQMSFATGMQANLLTINKALEGSEGRLLERLPSEVRKHAVKDSSRGANPKLNHPALRPMVEMVQERITAKYPDASAAEVQEMTNRYLTESFKAMGTEEEDTPGAKKPLSGSPKERIAQIAAGNGGMDWDTYLDTGGQGS